MYICNMTKGNKYIRNIKLHQLGIDVDMQYIEIYNFLEENLNGLNEFKFGKDPKSLFYGKDKDNIILELYNYKEPKLTKNNTLFVHYDKIWPFFREKYNVHRDDILVLLIWYVSNKFNFNPSNIDYSDIDLYVKVKCKSNLIPTNFNN